MDNENGGAGYGMFRQPAQRETISGGYEGGIRIPVIQAFASIVFASLGILLAWILLFVIGPDVLWCAGFIAIAIVARRVLLWIGTAQQETTEEVNGVRAMTIATLVVSLAVGGAWSVSRQFCIDHWPAILPQVSIWRTVFAISFIIPTIIVCALMAFQFTINAYNPAAFQPHQAKPPGTPWWSPTGQTTIETEPIEDEYLPEQIIQQVPRIVTRYDAAHPNPNGNSLQNILIDASERQHQIPESPPLNDRLIAPNGRTVRVADVNEFVIDGVTVGATFKTWHNRKGYSEEYWRALVETCANHGLATSPGRRKSTRLLVVSRREAVDALDHLWRQVFPQAPHPAPDTIGVENAGT